MNRKSYTTILEIIGILFVLQLLRIGIKSLCFLGTARTDFSDRVASIIAMTVLSIVILFAAKFRKINLSVFPKHFTAGYIVFSMMVAALLILSVILTKCFSIDGIVMLLYSAVVTPVFEELIFRGFVWNRLIPLFKKEWGIYLVSTLLFAVWHLGYIDSVAFRVGAGLANAMVWKAVTGLCFGIVLGALRLKTKNCYSTMLLHGILNLFGR